MNGEPRPAFPAADLLRILLGVIAEQGPPSEVTILNAWHNLARPRSREGPWSCQLLADPPA